MRYKTVVFGFVTIVLFGFGRHEAQAREALERLQDAEHFFDETLRTLRQSVVTLEAENQGFVEEGQRMQARLAELKQELFDLRQDETAVREEVARIDVKYQKKLGRSRLVRDRIGGLKKERDELDATCASLEAELEKKRRSEKDLRARVQLMTNDVSLARAQAATALTGEVARLDQELSALQKQALSSLVDLQNARAEWLQAQNMLRGSVPRGAEGLAREFERLREESQKADQVVLDLQRIVQVKEQALRDVHATGADRDRVKNLGKEIASLQAHYQRLEAQSRRFQGSVRSGQGGQEQLALKGRLAEVQAKNKTLRAELKQLRRQMVAMDKHKASLEREVYGP